MISKAALGLLAVLLLASCIGAPVTDPTALPAGEWQLDARHSSVTWGARHFGLAWVRGRFDRVEASLTFDPEFPERAQLVAIVDAQSISTGLDGFDETLRGGAWLATENNPQIVFRSSRVDVTGERTGQVTGMLTLRGIARETVMDVEFYGSNLSLLEGRRALGFGGDMVIDRSDFGVGILPSTIAGNEVRIHIEAEFLKD